MADKVIQKNKTLTVIKTDKKSSRADTAVVTLADGQVLRVSID